MNFNFQKINKLKGWLSRNEGRALYDLASELPSKSVIVEIGSFQGKSTICLGWGLQIVGSGEIFAIDPHLGQTHVGKTEFPKTYSAFLKNIKDFNLAQIVTPIRQKSEVAVTHWKKKINLLHVDGLHEYEFVKRDLHDWLPFLLPGGVVVCHDAFTPESGVFKAIEEEIIESGQFSYLAPNDSQIIAIKGQEQNLWQTINFRRQVFFVKLACHLWQNNKINYYLRFFFVNRILKIFFMNRFMFQSILAKFK